MLMERLIQDLRIAIRGFRRSPTFAVATVLILGLGIGMAVAMSTTVQAILVRRLPVLDQDRLAVLWTYQVPAVEYSAPASDLPEIRRASRTISALGGVAHWGAAEYPFVDGDRTIVLRLLGVTANYFDVLGTRPVLGRLFRPEDGAPGAPQVLVLSYAAWQSEFAANPKAIGSHFIDPSSKQPMTLVGVAPAGLDYPAGVEGWYSLPRDGKAQVFAVARLAPGATLDQARQEFLARASRLEPAFSLTGAKGEPFTTAVVGNVRPILVTLAAAVALLLVIAYINVGTLFVARAVSRTGEFSVRCALGADRIDLACQLCVESALVAAAGGAFGGVCAYGLLKGLIALAPPDIPRIGEVHLDSGFLGAAIGATTATVLLLGVVPAVVGTRRTAAASLQLRAGGGLGTAGRRQVRHWLAASQIGLALVMLSAAGLLGRSLLSLEHLPLGYQAEHLAVGSLSFNYDVYDSLDKITQLSEEVVQRIQSIPGVTAATPMMLPPFTGPNIWRVTWEPEAQFSTDSSAAPSWPTELAGPEYFRTFGIRIMQGRSFVETDRERTPPVVVVSQSVAHRFWPGDNPIGRRMRVAPVGCGRVCTVSDSVFDWRTVVGVVPDTRLRALRTTWPMVYLPERQMWGAWQGRFAVRSARDVAALGPAIRQAVREIDPTIAVYGLQSMDDVLGTPLAEPRLMALLITAFGAVALVLAAVGLYGAIASVVRERTHEIGVRMALGATPARIRDAILRQTLTITVAGASFGLLAALAVTRVLRALLFGVSPTDPVTLAAACAGLLAVAMAAAYVPTRRATQVDPVRALRAE
jgi:putative ABC transport system permease protein